MTIKKSPRGRPRKYKSDAERKKAYRERQKSKISSIEERIKELEEGMNNMQEIDNIRLINLKEVHEELTLPWMKLTPEEITNTETEQLKRYHVILRDYIKGGYTNGISSPLLSIFRSLLDLKVSSDKYTMLTDIGAYINQLVEGLEQVVLIYLIEAELTKRKREESQEYQIEKLERRIADLEKELKLKQSLSRDSASDQA